MKASTPLVPPRPPLRPHFQTGRARFLLALVSAGAGVDGPVGGLGGCAEPRWLRRAPSAAFPPRPTVLEAPRSGLQALADDAHAPLRADCLYAGSGHRTGVRGTGRGRYPRPVGEDPGQSAEPPSRGPRRPPIGGGFTWAHTVDAPPPHLRTRAGVVDVPPGRVGNPEARRQPPGASANEASPAQRCGTAPSPRKPTVRPAQSAPYARNSMSVRRPELERLFPAPPPGTLPCPCRGRREPGRR